MLVVQLSLIIFHLLFFIVEVNVQSWKKGANVVVEVSAPLGWWDLTDVRLEISQLSSPSRVARRCQCYFPKEKCHRNYALFISMSRNEIARTRVRIRVGLEWIDRISLREHVIQTRMLEENLYCMLVCCMHWAAVWTTEEAEVNLATREVWDENGAMDTRNITPRISYRGRG